MAEDDERHDDKKKKDSLKQAILGCPDLVSLEMFENLHRQKHGRPMAYEKYRTMVMDMCGSLDVAREASRSAQRLLLEARDNIDAILEDVNRQAIRRSHMDHHPSGHQDPPSGGDGSNHPPGGNNQNGRQPANLKDPNAYDGSGKPNVTTDSGGVNWNEDDCLHPLEAC